MVEEGLALLPGRESVIPYELAVGHVQLAELLSSSDAEGARLHAKEAWRIVKDIPAVDAWSCGGMRVRIARTLVQQGFTAEAEQLLLPVYAALCEQLGAENPDAEAARELIAEIYRRMGRPERAAAFAAPARGSEPGDKP
jgi:hypothetical protein